MRCPSIHKWSDAKCSREAGHDGYCYTRAVRSRSDGSINRTHWLSENGVFKSHHWYEKKYPRNAAKKANP